MERLQKIIAARGLCSRRQAEKWIEEGRVRVNGNTAHLGDTADVTEDVIEVDGKRLPRAGRKLYLMLNKPRGYVTTLSDEKGRKNAAELVAGCGVRVYPVGRLDMDSEALICFSLVVNSGLLPLLTASKTASTGMVYCFASFTPSIRRMASECPWLTPFPQKV